MRKNSGGETTVVLASDPGCGGRNQEAALAAWLRLAEAKGEFFSRMFI